MQRSNLNSNAESTSPKILLGILTGFVISFLIAGGVVYRWRDKMSRTDGENIFSPCAVIFLVVGLAALVVWRWQRKESRPKSWLGFAMGALLAVAVAATLYMSIPTQKYLTAQAVAKHSQLWQDKAEQLATIPGRVDAFLAAELDEQEVEAMKSTMSSAKMDFRFNMFDDFPEKWNAFVVNDSDFARLRVGVDPDSIMERRDMPKLPMFTLRTTDHKKMIDTLAEVAYSEEQHLYKPEDVESLARALTKMKYLAFVRMVEHNPPELVENSFLPGFSAGRAVFFDLTEDKIIGTCRFAATNSDKIEFRYTEGRIIADEYKESSAKAQLREDLKDNLKWEFFHEVGNIAPQAMTEQTERVDEEPPFTLQALLMARAIDMEKNKAEAEPVGAASDNGPGSKE